MRRYQQQKQRLWLRKTTLIPVTCSSKVGLSEVIRGSMSASFEC